MGGFAGQNGKEWRDIDP